MKRNHNKRGIVPVTIISIILGLVLTPSSGKDEPAITVPDGAQAGDLTIGPCTHKIDSLEFAADCGTLVVPENRNDPDSRLIALPFKRIHATGSNPTEPIFKLAGGPGASNRFFYSRWFLPSTGLIDNHDLVMVGYRGVDGSVVLDCPEVDEVFKNLPGDLFSKMTVDSLAAAYARCAERLQSEGVDTDGYTVAEVVDDMEAARAALGYDRINLLSYSYGTRVAMIYGWMYPESIHRSVMIGVNPPGHMVWEPEIIDKQIEYYANLCAQDPECSARTDDLAETMRTVARNMPGRWLFLPIKRDIVLAGTFFMLYNTGMARMVLDAWLAAGQGDASGLALLSLVGNRSFPPPIVWGDNIAKMTSVDYDPARDYRADMNPPNSIIGSPMSRFMPAVVGWPANPIPGELRQVQPSDVATLLVSGSIDFSTPAELATNELLPYLSNGQQVILSEFGHVEDVLDLQPEATVRLLSSFLDTGVADKSLYTYEAMDFHVGLGLPTMAKIGLGVVALIFVSVVSLVGWLVV